MANKCKKCKGNGQSLQPVFDHDDGSTAMQMHPCLDCKGTGVACESRTAYVVLRALTKFQTKGGVTLDLQQKGILGCMPIYTNKATAKKDYPKAKLLKVYLPKGNSQ